MNLDNYLYKNNYRTAKVNVVFTETEITRLSKGYNLLKISELGIYFEEDFHKIAIYL